MPKSVAQRYAPWLWLLLALFCVRVIAQLIALKTVPPFLPSFDAWHSALLPYPILVATQLAIVAVFLRTAIRFSRRTITPNRRTGRVLLVLASIYAIAMVARLLLGLTVLRNHAWFNHYIPTFFHLVLAASLGLVGHYHFYNAIPEKHT